MRSVPAALALILAIGFALLLANRGHDARAQGKPPDKGGGGNVQCTIDSVTPVAFGGYDSDSDVAHTSTGELRFSCKPANQTLTIKITLGPSSVSGSIADRAMRELAGSDQLHYNLFQDPRGSVLWGDGVTGGAPRFVVGQKQFSVEIYGIAPPAQTVAAGLYADTLRITILP